jgi:hypothetical protein
MLPLHRQHKDFFSSTSSNANSKLDELVWGILLLSFKISQDIVTERHLLTMVLMDGNTAILVKSVFNRARAILDRITIFLYCNSVKEVSSGIVHFNFGYAGNSM